MMKKATSEQEVCFTRSTIEYGSTKVANNVEKGDDESVGKNDSDRRGLLRRNQLHSWLRRKDSSLDLDNDVFYFFGARKKRHHLENVENVIETRRNTVETKYSSVNRILIDSPIWNRRKVELMESRKKRNKYNFLSFNYFSTTYLIIFIAIAMAVLGFFVAQSAERLVEIKLDFAEKMDKRYPGYGSVTYIFISCLLAFGAFIPVAYRPVSAGSGIAEAKAVLNGVIIDNCTSLETAFCKVISVILAVAASLPAGLEGPMIHLGLCIGDNASRLLSVVSRNNISAEHFHSDRARIDLATIGTAAGVAIAFHSPISGVLFALEEGSSFWSEKLMWRCFYSACLSVIMLYAILDLTTEDVFDIRTVALFTGIKDEQHLVIPSFQMWEYPVFIIFGIVGGLLGSIFCELNRALTIWRKRKRFSLTSKAFEVLLVTFVMATLNWFLPLFFSTCRSLQDKESGYFRQFNCAEDEYNELATLLQNPYGGVGINLLFHEDASVFSMKTCLIAGSVHLLMLLFVFGTYVSAGIFIPLLFAGACLGRAAAIAFNLNPLTYSVVGAAAMLGGVVRTLISLTAIVVNTTCMPHFITPIMLVTLMARSFGNMLFGRPGVYDIILELRGIPFLEEDYPASLKYETTRARHIMVPSIPLSTDMNVAVLLSILKSFDQLDFPVVDSARDGVLIGMIARSTILKLLCHKDHFHTTNFEVDTSLVFKQILSFYELYTTKTRSLKSIEESLSKEDTEKFIALTPYIQLAPHTFDAHGSCERAYEMFRTLGLRTLLILDPMSKPVGMITRTEFKLLEEVELSDEHFDEKQRKVSATYHIG